MYHAQSSNRTPPSQVILHPVGKVVVILATLFLLVGGIIGATKVTENFSSDWFIPTNSWVHGVLQVRDDHFQKSSGRGAIPFGVYTKNSSDYYVHQQELGDLAKQLQVHTCSHLSPLLL